MKLSHIVTSGAIAVCLCLPVRAEKFVFNTTLSGAIEAPPNASTGTGWSQAVYDDVAHTLSIAISFMGLVSPTTVAHIHAASVLTEPLLTAGVATTVPTMPGFPAGVTEAYFAVTLDLTNAASYNPAFITNAGGGTVAGAELALITFMQTDRAYLNVHTRQFPGGEIRGFYEVPDTATTLGLFGFALGILGLVARRSRLAA